MTASATTLDELVALFGGTLDGARGEAEVVGLCGIDAPRTRQRIAVLIDPRYRSALADFEGVAVVVGQHSNVPVSVPLWRHDDPIRLRRELHEHFAPFPIDGRWNGVSPDATVADGAALGEGVSVAPGAVVSAGSQVGPETQIGPGAVLEGARVGERCRIGARVWLGPGVVLGDQVEVGPNSVIGSQGFGYQQTEQGLERIPHIGGVEIGRDVQIGACVCIDAGTLHPTRVGSGSRIDNLVQIAHNVQIGRHCVLLAQAGIAGSAVLEDQSVVAGQAGVAGHVTLGRGAMVAAQAGVGRDLSPGARVGGTPAFELGKWRRVSVLLQSLRERFKLGDELRERIERLERQRMASGEEPS